MERDLPERSPRRGFRTSRRIVTGLVALHLAVVLWHGTAHASLAIGLPWFKNAFVYVVIVFCPLLSAALIRSRRYEHLALSIFTVAMFGALLFGVYHHYVMVSPDNVHHLPAGSAGDHAAFTSSAVAVALVELAALLYGVFRVGQLSAAGFAPGRRPKKAKR